MITKAKVTRALEFCRILNEDGNLSLTNLVLMAAVARTLAMPTLSIHDLFVFLGTVASYQAKSLLSPQSTADNSAELQTAVAELQTKVTGLQLSGQLTNSRR